MRPGTSGSRARVPASPGKWDGVSSARVRFRIRAVRFLPAVIMALLVQQPAGAQEGREYLEVDGGYKTGDFGTPTRTDLTYFTAVLGYVSPVYDVSVTLPYLFLSNSTGGRTSSESGIGDVLVRGGMVLVPEGKGGLSLDGSLAVKLPTASDAKGLGTGKTDYGAFIGLHQRIGQYKIFLNGGYIKVGEPSNVSYNDIYLYDVGISGVFGFTELYAFFEGRQAVVPGAKNPQEITVGLFHVLNAEYAVKGSTFLGLNNGGPDFGFNLGLVRWF
jgi:hypothetical protein